MPQKWKYLDCPWQQMKCPYPAIAFNRAPFDIFGLFKLIDDMPYAGALEFEAFGEFGLSQSWRAENVGKRAPLGAGQVHFGG